MRSALVRPGRYLFCTGNETELNRLEGMTFPGKANPLSGSLTMVGLEPASNSEKSPARIILVGTLRV